MKLVIFDGNSIFNRAFYGIRLLTNKQGFYTNAIFGFLNIYLKFLEEIQPDCVCVAFDLKGPTFRHEKYDNYKAQRTGMPEEMAIQLPVLKEVLAAMNVEMLTLERYEADDIIGTVSRICDEKSIECNIITGDKDDLQLITKNVQVHLITTRMGQTTTAIMDEVAFEEKYQLKPKEMIDLKALMGDASDNIPGVAGVGEKTAQKLLQKFKTLKALYEQIEQSDEKPTLKKKLADGKEMAFLSYDLATIDCFAPITFSLEATTLKEYHTEQLRGILEKLELKNLITRLCGDGKTEETKKIEEKPSYKVLSFDEIDLKKIATYPALYIALYDGGVGFSDGKEIFLVEKENFLYQTVLKTIWETDCILKYTHDIKTMVVAMEKLGISVTDCAFDCFIGAYLEDPSRSNYDIAQLASIYLDKHTELDKKAGKDEAYVANSLQYMPLVCKHLIEEIEKNNQHTLYYTIEQPLCFVLADMEIRGFRANKDILTVLGKELDEKIKILQGEICTLAGEEFNINSPKQLGVVLFEKMGLPVIKKTKTGYSTDIDVLNKLIPYDEIAGKIVTYRQYAKLNSTYVEGLLNVIGEDGKIHSSFNQTITQTGRLSSTEPNLQNIPVRLEMGREIRKVFVPENSDCVLVDADYSQIELRVLADIAKDDTMINAFKNGVDIHTLTASQVFHTPLEEVTSKMRSNAKAVNFGIVYGIGEFSLSEDLHITRKEAKEYIDSYLSTYHGVRAYMTDVVEQGKKDGYVTTLLGRKRYIPELNASNHNIREFGKRCAMNTPIQGSAADIIKIAMVGVYKTLKERGLKSYLVLQIHDELIINTYREELEEVKTILKDQMENAYPMDVRLEIDMSVGDSWYSAKG